MVLRDGLIEAVGEDVTIPADAWVIEGEGLTVYPGLIDALSTWGIPGAAPRPPAAADAAVAADGGADASRGGTPHAASRVRRIVRRPPAG